MDGIKITLLVIQVILSLSLVLLILIQPKSSGGLTRSWGSTTSFTRRGLEKLMFRATFVIVALFIIISAAQLVI
jgi:protein translocase SecG subunit